MRVRALLVLLLIAAGCRPAGMPPAATPARDTLVLSIVATTDLHGHLEALPWLAGHLRNLRAARQADGGHVLLVDAGDMWQGTLESNLSEGAAVVRAYNALGYHAAAIGNHEFDFGPVGPASVPRVADDNPTGNIELRATEARFPFLAANLALRDGGPWTPPNVRPSALVTLGSLRIGLVGVTTSLTPFATDPRNLVRLQVTPLLDAVQREATRLRADGATVVVVLAHAGGRCDDFDDPDDLTSCRPQSEIFRLARAMPAGLVDVIAAGHSHDAIAHRVNGIAIVQANHLGRSFGRVDLTLDARSGAVRARQVHAPRHVCTGTSATAVPFWGPDACRPPAYEGRPVRHDGSLVRLVRREIRVADRRRDEPLGAEAGTRYWHSTRAESPVSNLVVDLLRAAVPSSDVAIYNVTGTRAELAPGPITYGDLYALLPFDSVIATAELPASTIADAVARAVTSGPFPALSGLEAEVRCEGDTLRVLLLRDGAPLPREARLRVVTSEFLSAGGGDYFPGLADRFTLQLDMPMREAVAGAVRGQAERIRAGVVGGYDGARTRVRVPGDGYPVRCTR